MSITVVCASGCWELRVGARALLVRGILGYQHTLAGTERQAISQNLVNNGTSSLEIPLAHQLMMPRSKILGEVISPIVDTLILKHLIEQPCSSTTKAACHMPWTSCGEFLMKKSVSCLVVSLQGSRRLWVAHFLEKISDGQGGLSVVKKSTCFSLGRTCNHMFDSATFS